MVLRKLIIPFATLLLLWIVSPAQVTQPTPQQSNLVLEVVFLKGKSPAYQSVYDLKRDGTRYGLFGRVPGWQLPSGALPVTAVRVTPYVRGETVNVSVSVFRGQFFDVEDRVATYKARQSEVITIRELADFGVEPFVIKVIRVTLPPPLPTVETKTKSVSVVGMEPVDSTLPRYKLLLHNLSEKNIIALHVLILGQGRMQKSHMPQGDYGAVVIKARGSMPLNESLAVNAEATPSGYEPATPQAQHIVIESAVFADGSYEGELKPAATFLAFVVGRKTELRRILPLLDDALTKSDDSATIDTLRSQLSSLSYDPDEAEVAALSTAFPTLDKRELRMAVEIAIHGVRKKLIDQLQRAQRSESSARAFSAWLVKIRQQHADWLSRLDEINVSER